MMVFRILVVISLYLKAYGQTAKLTTRLEGGELKMRFPAIYFVHGTTDYAPMPYTVDSCLKYILSNLKHIQDFNIWRDSSETESLSRARVLKLRKDISRVTNSKSVRIQSMGAKQKISQRTIRLAAKDFDRDFLLSLNSAFEYSTAKFGTDSKVIKFCWHCFTRFRRCQANTRFFMRLRGK